MQYLNLDIKKIRKNFEIVNQKKGTIEFKYGKAKPIKIKLPFKLNENMAKIAAMILDGSLSKNYKGVMFSQKKDIEKVKEFNQICQNLFNISGRIAEKDGCLIVVISSMTLAKFFHSCLDIHKSDEFARIPKWIWNSPKEVIFTYLRYTFAMEGSVDSYLKGNEVKFHSCDLPYLKELRRLLKLKADINSKIFKYYIKGYGYKYYVHFAKRKEVLKFAKIGFALDSHQKRLEEIVKNFKAKAWEITLVKILSIKKKSFRIRDVNRFFDYLHKRSIHFRLISLVEKGYLLFCLQRGYCLTPTGRKKALYLKDKIKITSLRTYPKENENQVLSYLKDNGKGYRNQIARDLKICPITIRDSLRRLLKQDKVIVSKADKFQRKFYIIR